MSKVPDMIAFNRMLDHARKLERELAQARAELERAQGAEADLAAMLIRAERAEAERDVVLTDLRGVKKYRESSPLGGPAKVFDAMADSIRAGSDFYAVLREYQFCTEAERDANKQDAERLRDGDVLHVYDHPSGRRDWVTVGTWLQPGQSIIVVDAAIDAARGGAG